VKIFFSAAAPAVVATRVGKSRAISGKAIAAALAAAVASRCDRGSNA
jgi:hypothetical protein